MKWTSALVFLLGLSRPLFADTAPPIAPPADPARGTCGSAPGWMRHALADYCANATDEKERLGCRHLLRAFRGCSSDLFVRASGRSPIATVTLPSRRGHDPIHAMAWFERGPDRAIGVEIWEGEECDC